MNNLESNKAIARRFNDLFDAQDVEGCLALLASDMKGYATGAPGPMDRDSFVKLGQQFMAAFTNTKHTYLSQIAEGDKVATYAKWRATNSGSFNGIPPSGKTIEMEIFVLDTIRDGKIVEHRGYFDVMAMMTQIGAIPAAA
jgi:steroid delta-isomerase-like uncharacterized protein